MCNLCTNVWYLQWSQLQPTIEQIWYLLRIQVWPLRRVRKPWRVVPSRWCSAVNGRIPWQSSLIYICKLEFSGILKCVPTWPKILFSLSQEWFYPPLYLAWLSKNSRVGQNLYKKCRMHGEIDDMPKWPGNYAHSSTTHRKHGTNQTIIRLIYNQDHPRLLHTFHPY